MSRERKRSETREAKCEERERHDRSFRQREKFPFFFAARSSA